jgi:uncharacterized Zn-finger protein
MTSSMIVDETAAHKLVCEFCYKSFNHKGHLRVHLRSHTKEKPFPCHLCDAKFTTNSNRKAHFFNIHKAKKVGGIIQKSDDDLQKA